MLHFNLNAKSVTLLFFVIHACIFSGLLIKNGIRDEKKNLFWLSGLLLLGALYIFPFMAGYAGWYAVPVTREILLYTPFQHLLFISPVLYFYLKSLLDNSFIFSRRDIAHLLPGFLYCIYSLILFLNDYYSLTAYKFYADGRDKDFDVWYQVAGFTSLSLYALLSLRLYWQYQSIICDTLSFADEVRFRWARDFLLLFTALLALRLIFFITNPEWGQFGRKFWYYAGFGGILYYLSLNGYVNTLRSIVSLEKSKPTAKGVAIVVPSESARPPDEEIEKLKSTLVFKLTTDSIYKNSRLTVSHLAQATGLPAKQVSQLINKGFNMNFNDFINYYRVMEVCKMINEGHLKTKTLLGIAQDSGFHSKTTFNRAFKQIMKTSPSDYAEQIRQK